MNYYLSQLKWIINALALDPKQLYKLLPVGDFVPLELVQQYEGVVDEDLSNIQCILSADQLKEIEPLNTYLYMIIQKEELADCWYDNNFVYSPEWQVLHTMAKDFEQYMGWQISEPLPPLYSQVIDVSDGLAQRFLLFQPIYTALQFIKRRFK
ncbi:MULTISPECIES: hypothetical protein [unclassified Psychrobacter]|uniref:hypothetical protein n=1 Tax=unclassified Psychrobacter TaxID=196806 RepID=UPI0018F5DA72|nr:MULTISPECIES: hypothetical protein [unclassified Psychrobacter]